MFLVYGEDEYLNKKQIEKIINLISENKNYDVEKFSVINDSFDDIINSALTVSMFEDAKITIVNDSYFLTEQKIQLHKTYSIEKLELLLNNIPEENTLIFNVKTKTYSKRLKIVNKITEMAKVIEVKQLEPDNIRNVIVSGFKKHNIKASDKIIDYLLMVLPVNMNIISNELSKIYLFNDELTFENIKTIINDYREEDIFNLNNYYLENDAIKFIKELKLFMNKNNDLFSVLGLLAANLIILRNSLLLLNEGLNSNEIASKLSLNPYRIKKILQIKSKNIADINEKLLNLWSLNYNIKSGNYDMKILPEIELLKTITKGGKY
ncbi:DNA polymerase III subunit delta [Spiroplasma endosymbiont of Labia minor]|uniref:DNA polymerase III subunit delta n=1 Tax=Spiroplasma endosymbiont of Labia minor TaxID=3066305 RepID=UPI0030CE2B20